MFMHLWMMPAMRLSALGQHQTMQDWSLTGICWSIPWGNAGTQVVLALFDPSSLIHLAPIPAMTCFSISQSPFPGNPHQDFYLSPFPEQSPFSILPVCSGSIFLPRFFMTSTPSIQSLAYFLFFQLALQLPGRISGHSSSFICLLVISPALPSSQTYP